jgi:hypothetical protein
VLNTRLYPSARLLITAARNAAVGALLDKLSRSPQLSRQLVLVGSCENLGLRSAPFLLDKLVQEASHDGDKLWINMAFLVHRALHGIVGEARAVHRSVCFLLQNMFSTYKCCGFVTMRSTVGTVSCPRIPNMIFWVSSNYAMAFELITSSFVFKSLFAKICSC